MPKDEQTDSVDVFDEYLTVNEIAKTLRLNGQTVRNMIDRGELRAIRVGQRRVRVLRADLDAFLAGQTDAPAQLTPARRETLDERFAELEDQIRACAHASTCLSAGRTASTEVVLSAQARRWRSWPFLAMCWTSRKTTGREFGQASTGCPQRLPSRSCAHAQRTAAASTSPSRIRTNG